MPLSPGQVLNNRYRIVKLLGQGGFGAVYRAWDTNLERPRALKENLDTSPEAQRQFKREAQMLCDLTRSNLPKVIDHFVIQGQGQYLVMEFVEGEDLGTMLEKAGGPLPEAQVLDWASQVCDALEYLHSRKPPIIHRDIKPANIKITPEGKAMLVDFGIAKVYDPNLSTTAGARAVTPGYSPQEQYGIGTTDARTDIYALGATLYHLLTGKQPPESVQRTIGIQLEPPSKLNPVISVNAQNAILKAMEPVPDNRYQSIGDFHQALLAESSQSHPAQVQKQTMQKATNPVSAPHRIAKPPSVSRALPWKWIAAMIALGLVALLVYIFPRMGGEGNRLTTTSPAVAIITTTSIPFSPTLPPNIPSKTSTISPIPTDTRPFTLTPTITLTPVPTLTDNARYFL
jgi:eukaryotic-like serine/threonine-protein kinase